MVTFSQSQRPERWPDHFHETSVCLPMRLLHFVRQKRGRISAYGLSHCLSPLLLSYCWRRMDMPTHFAMKRGFFKWELTYWRLSVLTVSTMPMIACRPGLLRLHGRGAAMT